MKKIILFVFALVLVSTVMAQSFYRQDDLIEFKTSCIRNNTYCTDTAVCNLTLINPEDTLMINNQQMTNQVSHHNYTIPATNTSILGEYKANVVCVDSGVNGFEEVIFEITPSGEEMTTGEALFRIGMVAVLCFFTIVTIYGAVKSKRPFMKALFFGLIWFVLTALFYTLWISSHNLFVTNTYIPRFFFWFFTITLYLAFPMFLGGWMWYFYLIYKMKPIQEMIDRGVPEDRIIKAQTRKDMQRVKRDMRKRQ